MPSFNPSTIVRDLKGVHLPGEIERGTADRTKLNELRKELAICLHKDATQAQAARAIDLEEELTAFIKEKSPETYLGDYVQAALQATLRKKVDDPQTPEERSPADAAKHGRWAMKIAQAMKGGITDTVEFDVADIDVMRDRVARHNGGSAAVLWCFEQALADAAVAQLKVVGSAG